MNTEEITALALIADAIISGLTGKEIEKRLKRLNINIETYQGKECTKILLKASHRPHDELPKIYHKLRMKKEDSPHQVAADALARAVSNYLRRVCIKYLVSIGEFVQYSKFTKKLEPPREYLESTGELESFRICKEILGVDKER